MENLINLYTELENPNSDFNNIQNIQKPTTQKKSIQQKGPIVPKKKENKLNKINNKDKYDPLSILNPKKNSTNDNDDNNIIVGKEDIKAKIEISLIEKIIDNLNDKKHNIIQ